VKSSKQDATKKQIRRVEGNLAVGGGTFGVRLRDQHFAMTGITSSSDMYLLFIMICNRQRCASLYSTGLTVGLQGSAIALTPGREPLDSLTLRLKLLRRKARDYRYAYNCTSDILCPTNPTMIRVAYLSLIRANGREATRATDMNIPGTTGLKLVPPRDGYPHNSNLAPWCRRHTLSLNLVTWEVTRWESVRLNTLIPTCRNRAASLFRSVAG
jgi:hypothetical protein